MKRLSFILNLALFLCFGLLTGFLWSCAQGVDESGSKPPANNTPPTVTISYPQVNSSVVGTAVYLLKFSEAVTGLTGNNLNAACEGSLQLNPSNGGNCYPISISSTDNINWTVDPVGELSDGDYKLTVTTAIQNLSAISLAGPTSVTFNVKDALSTVANQLETDLLKAGLSPSIVESAKEGARTTGGDETNDLLNVIPAAFDGAFDAITAAGLNEAFTQAALSTIIESLLSNVAGVESLVSVHSSARVAALSANFSTLLKSLTTRVATKSASSSTTLQTLTAALVSSLPAAGATATEIETTYVSSIVQTATTVVMATTPDTTTRDSVLAGLGAGVIAGAKQITTVTVDVATIQTATTTSMITAAASSDTTYDVGTATTAVVTAVNTETPTTTEATTPTVVETIQASCFLSGQTVAHDSSVVAYQASSVAFGNTCMSEIRTCQNGALSGSYTNASCTVNSGATCSLNGQTVAHGSSVVAYQASSVAFGDTCMSEIRTCQNGNLTGTHNYQNCVVSIEQVNENRPRIDTIIVNGVLASKRETFEPGLTLSIQVNAADPNSLPLEYQFSHQKRWFNSDGSFSMYSVTNVKGYSPDNTLSYEISSDETADEIHLYSKIRNNDSIYEGYNSDDSFLTIFENSRSDHLFDPVIEGITVNEIKYTTLSEILARPGSTLSIQVNASDPNSLPLEYQFSHQKRWFNSDGSFSTHSVTPIKSYSPDNTLSYEISSGETADEIHIYSKIRNNDIIYGNLDSDDSFLVVFKL